MLPRHPPPLPAPVPHSSSLAFHAAPPPSIIHDTYHTRALSPIIPGSSPSVSSTPRPARRFKSLTEIENEDESPRPTLRTKPFNARKAAREDRTRRRKKKRRKTTSTAAVTDAAELEALRSVLISQLQHARSEVANLQALVSEAEADDVPETHVDATDDVVKALLASNSAMLATAGERAQKFPDDVGVNTMPHMPDPKLSLEHLQMFSGLAMRPLSSSLEYATSPDNDALIRIARYAVAVSHADTGISFTLNLVVNQTDVELISFALVDHSIRPASVRQQLRRWAHQKTTPATDDLVAIDVRQHDISCFLYGVAEFTRVARIRARVFAGLAKEFPGMIALHVPSSPIYTWFGETCITLHPEHEPNGLQLVISWDLDFDNTTGDVSSRVTAYASAPAYYQDLDTENVLARIPQAFASLLRLKSSVFAASRLLVRNFFATD
ncbi:uncharacterized protein V1518DRAFT_431805 [Limtongia smithiae]|uniref:uncharacterized protein n=1 Tax=Limtongia smithiae TaxID=1125753 RepID=UPI0034CF3B64